MAKKKTTKAKTVKKKAVKNKTAKKEAEPDDADVWSDEDLIEDHEEIALEDIDIDSLEFTKLKDLKLDMKDVNIVATIDFVGETHGKGYGEDPFAIGFLRDGTGEIKMTFWGDDLQSAKPKKKVRIIKASVGEYRGQLQLYPNRQIGIEFL
ncbi:MAG: hypothetical protein V1729_03685 [Candidatus Woesearchaeota archaeon]